MRLVDPGNAPSLYHARVTSTPLCAGPCGFPYCPLREVAPKVLALKQTAISNKLPAPGQTHFAKASPQRRIIVVGTTCTGKTTLARSLARLFDRPHVEFDALFWNANWQFAPNSVVAERLRDSTSGPVWILDGNCLEFKDIVWDHIDTLIWLDYSLPIILWRAVTRTIKRCLTRELLWGKNVESWRRSFMSPDSPLVWALKSWHLRRRDYNRILRSPATRHLEIHRFRSTKETADWLCGICSEHNVAQAN
jgi:adenylate kinase family enzyme